MRFSSLLVAMLFGPLAFAQLDRSKLKAPAKIPQFDLIQESESLSVLKEESVQVKEPSSRHVISVMVGEITSTSLQLASHNRVVDYDLGQGNPYVEVSLGYYPVGFWGFGLLSSVNYSWREQMADSGLKTALHMLSGDLMVAYRYERSSKSWLKPYAGAGAGINSVFQRGIDELNTSTARGIGVATLGTGINLNRIFNSTAPLDWELNLQYKRWIDPGSSSANYSGQLLSAGISMAL